MAVLHEQVEQASLQIDRETGTIAGVRVCGRESRNRRVYEQSALEDLSKLYEKKSTHLKHGTDDYSDVVGFITKPEVREGGVYGTWRLNQGHQKYGQILWDAENNPSALALSHEVPDGMYEAETDKDGILRVSRIHEVGSVAVVMAKNAGTSKSLTESIMDLTTLKVQHAPLLEEYSREVKKPLEEEKSVLQTKLAEALQSRADLESRMQKAADEHKAIIEERDSLLAEKKVIEKRQSIRKLAEELKAGDLTDDLVETMVVLEEKQVRTLLEDRASRRPAGDAPNSVSGFRQFKVDNDYQGFFPGRK